ncbi:hypothetical protein BCR34DRAFT_481892 [Clohesyomyces aquaticus]|uniref:Tubby C-terminal-like domain-containing protein n=1 Tax=Clohesyomyces aquaticus TaxID=1231657 RepID=A0A1Y1ZRV4_9PLEO|nr:hypothetical protein BCR34DRAFT_481892 [Clohesyomyces aquaticus]
MPPLERVPSYYETETADNTHHASSTNPAPSQDPALSTLEEPPAYSLIPPSCTSFSIYGTFIHTSVGPAYQLSRALDQRGPQFRIRRLRPREFARAHTEPLPFDKEGVLYEVNDPPFGKDTYFMRGFRRGCFPGTLELKFSGRKWHVLHIARSGTGGRDKDREKGSEILSMKVGGFGSGLLRKKRQEEGSQWKDAQGKVLATEVLRVGDDGGVLPVVELVEGLDQSWRELLVTVWAARLWVATGEEKTLALGGRF